MSTQISPVAAVTPVVTRVEVIDHVGDAFAAGPLTRSDILVAASRMGARPAVLELLERLPDRKFSRPHELWTDLRDVPIEH
jgi:Protein of unknown function (DUF2795)